MWSRSNGGWVWSRKAALVNDARRDWVSGLVTAHQANFAGCARTRGGLGAEFWAMAEIAQTGIKELLKTQKNVIGSLTVPIARR